MFERLRTNRPRRADSRPQDTSPTGPTAVADRPGEPVADDRVAVDDRTAVRDRPATAPVAADALTDRRERQRSEFGGLDWPAAFFGWLVAIGVATMLVAILAAAGTAIGITELDDAGDAASNADTIGIVGGVLLVATLLLAYYAGGYVAGRMARFDGTRQGLAVWGIALAVTLLLAAAGAILGAEYNV